MVLCLFVCLFTAKAKKTNSCQLSSIFPGDKNWWQPMNLNLCRVFAFVGKNKFARTIHFRPLFQFLLIFGRRSGTLKSSPTKDVRLQILYSVRKDLINIGSPWPHLLGHGGTAYRWNKPVFIEPKLSPSFETWAGTSLSFTEITFKLRLNLFED